MPVPVESASADAASRLRPSDRTVLLVGAVLFALTIAGYLAFTLTNPFSRVVSPVDLRVYQLGGQVVAQMGPRYNPALQAPLYDWPGIGLKFTYPPFAAIVFTIFALAAWGFLIRAWLVVNVAALVATIWLALGGLGYRADRVRLGGTLALAAVLFWTEPVQRTMYLGQVELVLMALIIWDLCQPDGRRWKGIGIGIAAGIKLVPLIFIPYLLFTRRYRQAVVAAGAFVATVIIGFAVLPADSRDWWLDGLVFKSARTGFTGWEGNQSLAGLITRLSGSIAAGQPIWMAAALAVVIGGIACAVALDRAGHRLMGVLTCALTGLLISPISWDHHWVWIVPAVTVLAHYGIRARGWPRRAWFAGGALIVALFGAWPGFLWGQPNDLGAFSEGLIWSPPNTAPGTFARLGDRPWYAEYHWHGFQLVVGNVYVLGGLVLLLVAAGSVLLTTVTRRRRQPVQAIATVSATSAVGR